jgi:hypothetical protein
MLKIKTLRILALYFTVSIGSLSLHAQGPLSDSLGTILAGMEEKMFVAIGSADAASLNALLSPDYITINADGVLETREEMLKTFGKFKGRHHSLSERTVRVSGETAIITGRAKFVLNALLVSELFYTEVWICNKGTWQIASWQGTMTGLPSLYPEFTVAILAVLIVLLLRVIVTMIKQKKERRIASAKSVAE